MKKFLLYPIAALLLTGLAACSSTPHKVDDEDLSSNWSGQAFSDLLIVGAYTDRSFRIGSETQFSEELKSRGVKATPSYTLIPDTTVLDNNAEIRAKLATMPHDAVLIVATLDEGYEYDAGDYFATRGMVSLLGGEPGAATDMGSFIAWAGSGLYTLHISLWDARTGQVVWQVTTDSESTGSESGDTKALAEFVVDELRKKGLL